MVGSRARGLESVPLRLHRGTPFPMVGWPLRAGVRVVRQALELLQRNDRRRLVLLLPLVLVTAVLALRRDLSNCTVISITHRLTTTRSFDRRYRLEGGIIVDDALSSAPPVMESS